MVKEGYVNSDKVKVEHRKKTEEVSSKKGSRTPRGVKLL